MNRAEQRIMRVLCGANPPRTDLEIAKRSRTSLFRVRQLLESDAFIQMYADHLAEVRRFGNGLR